MKTRPGVIVSLAGPDWVRHQPEHHRQTVIAGLNNVTTIAADFNAAADAARKDRLLSPEGRDASIAKAAAAAVAMLDALDHNTTKISDRANGIEKALLAKHAAALPKDVPHDALREVRDQLHDLSPAERMNIYRSPTTDPLVLLAIETAPPSLGSTRQDGSRRFEPFVDPEELAITRLERATAADPTAAAIMHELRSVAEVFRLASGSVRREIIDAAVATVPKGA